MKPLLPGQAAVAHFEGQARLIACDHRENITLGGTAFLIVGGIHHVRINDVHVPVVNILVRLTTPTSQTTYVGWIDELQEHVIESLANQAELPIMLVSPLGERIAKATIHNGIRGMMQKQLGVISSLAEKTPWQPQHFAAARVFIAFQHTPESLWTALGGE